MPSTATTTVVTVEPGNGSRYVVVVGTTDQGEPFVAVPSHQTAAIMGTYPVESGYVAEKLRLPQADAEAVFAVLRSL
jgi:hypothetical protein